MSWNITLVAAVFAVLASPALTGELSVEEAYARASSPTAKTGAAFMTIRNVGDRDDRLISVSSEIAARVELHDHVMDGDIMRMVHADDGFAISAGESLRLERGGKHVMFMGLTQPFVNGDALTVTLTFEQSGEMEVEIPVDLER